MIRRIATAVLTVGALAACKPTTGPAAPSPDTAPAASVPTVEPRPDSIPPAVRSYHDGRPSTPGEGYASCDGPNVSNYYPDTPQGWNHAVQMCAETGDYTARVEDELRRRGIDGEVGG